MLKLQRVALFRGKASRTAEFKILAFSLQNTIDGNLELDCFDAMYNGKIVIAMIAEIRQRLSFDWSFNILPLKSYSSNGNLYMKQITFYWKLIFCARSLDIEDIKNEGRMTEMPVTPL